MTSQPQDQPRRFERVLLVLFLLTLPLANPWVRGDGVGYYAFVRAPLIEHNLDFTHDYLFANESFREGKVDETGHVRSEYRTATGHLENHFTVGPALLWSPFLLLTHVGVLVARYVGVDVAGDGFSAPYRYALAFATAVYGFLGLWLSFRLARKYVRPAWSFVATVAIWFASSLPVYMYFNPAWSHAHSAFVVALFLWYWERTRPERSAGQWLVLGLIAGLMADVYFPNGVILLVPLVESIYLYFSRRTAGARAIRNLFVENVGFMLAFLASMLPTFITRKIIFGGYLRFGAYPEQPWDWSAPYWRSVLFSADHGLLSWTPLLGFALLGLLFAWRPARTIALYFGIAALGFFYLISSYPCWDGISSFGNRFFVSLTPIFVFGLAVLFERIARRFSSERTSFVLLSAILACFALWNFGFIFQWGDHLIPVRGPISWSEVIHNQFAVVPREIRAQLSAYLFRRASLMRQIEQRDIEQLNQSAQP